MGAAALQTQDILVLDSGVGGLSVAQAVLKRNPQVRIHYLADDAYCPYGLMSEADLSARLITLTEHMLAHCQPALVILACNTVSTLLLPTLRERFQVPFVGVVPAIKPAAEQTTTQHIALLATPATIKRHYLDGLINDFAADCQVERLGSSELVHQAERYLIEGELDQLAINQELGPLGLHPELDFLVLGCTHFPLIKHSIAKALPAVQLIDSGEAIARQVQRLLGQASQSRSLDAIEGGLGAELEARDISRQKTQQHELYFTGKVPNTEVFKTHLAEMGLEDVALKAFRF